MPAAALAASAVVAGCGGVSSSTAVGASASSTAALTIVKAALIKRADAICRHTDNVQKARLTTWEKRHPNASLLNTGEQEKALVYAAIPPLAAEIDAISALGVPQGGAPKVGAIVSGWRSALRKIEQKPSLLLEGGEGQFTAPDNLAAEYGFKDCAKAL
jgi:hypothetical protein